MKNKKLQLNDLKIKSFVTEVEKTDKIQGGALTPTVVDVTTCTRFSCGIRACTENVLQCF